MARCGRVREGLGLDLEVCPGALRGSGENGVEACNPTMKEMLMERRLALLGTLEGSEQTPPEK
jgi:hypothetical protein